MGAAMASEKSFSKLWDNPYEVGLGKSDLANAELKVNSLIRTNKIFTATGDIIEYELGTLNHAKLKEVEDRLIQLITGK